MNFVSTLDRIILGIQRAARHGFKPHINDVEKLLCAEIDALRMQISQLQKDVAHLHTEGHPE